MIVTNYMKPVLQVFVCLALSLFLTGCGPAVKQKQEEHIIAGKATIAEAAGVLNARRLAMIPVRSSGELTYEEFKDGKRSEDFTFRTVTLRFVPDRQIYFRANSLVGEAIRLGGNAEKFWLRMKPKEVSRYWWGYWKDLDRCNQQLLLSPGIMLEALGMVDIDNGWVLENQPGFDVLSKVGGKTAPLKKVYVRTSDYLIDRIEYFAGSPTPQAQLNLSEYENVTENISIPGKITILSVGEDTLMSKVEIRLKGIKLFEPSKKQLDGLFEPADTRGVEHVYRLGDGCQFELQDDKEKH